jgi:hypothetical protein
MWVRCPRNLLRLCCIIWLLHRIIKVLNSIRKLNVALTRLAHVRVMRNSGASVINSPCRLREHPLIILSSSLGSLWSEYIGLKPAIVDLVLNDRTRRLQLIIVGRLLEPVVILYHVAKLLDGRFKLAFLLLIDGHISISVVHSGHCLCLVAVLAIFLTLGVDKVQCLSIA